jgi:hypothetical protein
LASLKSKDSQMFQRSRAKWLKEGDENTGYFHACVKTRRNLIRIVALKVDGVWIENPGRIKEVIVEFFRQHFSSERWQRPTLDGVPFLSVSPEDNASLVRPFSLEEIELVVKESDGNKSPGPDGFNFSFFKAFWDIMKAEVRILFDQFHGNAKLPKGFASFFVALIPKVDSPFGIGDFRPISLLGSLYKLIAKVLASRLSSVMGSIIASSQSAFIKGRQLMDGVVVMNEIIDYARRAKKECLIFKIDFSKAYDSVEWPFLEYMLKRFGFNDQWCSWIIACVFAGNLSVLVNGVPTEEISISKGLKQGDPLAPFLFLLVAEGLGGLMKRAVELQKFKGFSFGGSELVISHLQCADDTLLIGEASSENLWAIKAILRAFELASGLRVNFHKSCLLGVNVSNEFLNMGAEFLNCRLGSTPFKYLGLPVGANPRRLATWQPLLDSLHARLNVWRNRYVSLGGRLTLLNAVLSAIPIFFLSFMKLPASV